MSRSLPAGRTGRVLTLAVGGLFAGHYLLYRLVAPNSLQRAYLLASTGHSYLPAILPVAGAVGMIALVAAVLAGFRRGRHPEADGGRGQSLARALLVPALVQAVAFLVLEGLERAMAGVPLTTLLGPLLPLGVFLQLVVGALG